MTAAEGPDVLARFAQARLFVVFDTNAYLSTSQQTLNEMLARCAEQNIFGLASFFVAQELLAHVAEETDGDFRFALAAIRKLVAHCSHAEGDQSVVRFIGDGEGTVPRALFGEPPPDERNDAASYGALLGAVSRAKSPEDLRQYRALIGIRQTVEGAEKAFTEHMWRSLIVSLVPEARTWDAVRNDPMLQQKLRNDFESERSLSQAAIELVNGTAKRCGFLLDDRMRRDKVRLALSLFPTPLHFLRLVARKIALEGYSLWNPKHANAIWDLQLAYSTSSLGFIIDIPIWVVTDDKLLLQAAQEAKSQRVFRPMRSFLDLIRENGQNLIAEIDRRD